MANMSNMPVWQQLALGGTSVLPAVIITHPIDTIKLRLQLQGYNADDRYKGALRGLIRIMRDEGIPGLYVGLSPAILRAFTFSSTRLGLYEPLRSAYAQLSNATEPTFGVKLAAGLTSGALGKAFAMALLQK